MAMVINPCFAALLTFCSILPVSSALSAPDSSKAFLRDRNDGIATSMFGTFIARHQTLVYPFYEFYYDHNTEYSPADFGYPVNTDFEGRTMAHEGLIFAAFGITDWLMIEAEAAVITETIWKSDDDNSGMPDSIRESGLGDIEGQLRWRYFKETEKRPEMFSYFETVFPLQPDRKIIGTQDWEFKLGAGIIKGFNFGTMTLRAGAEYDAGEEEFALGECAVEYLRKVSERIRLFGMVEGNADEVEAIAECQIHLNPHAYLKIGSGFGITPSATDIAPEIGAMFVF